MVIVKKYGAEWCSHCKFLSKELEEVMENKEIFKSNDLDWLDARSTISVGDKEYLEHVLSYVEDKDNICFKKDDGNIFCSISNKNVKKM